MILLTKGIVESLQEGDILIDQYHNGKTFKYELKEIHHDDTYVFESHDGRTFKTTREQILNDLPPEQGASFIIKKKRDDESILESL